MAKTKETRAKAKPGDGRLGNEFWKFRTRHGPKQLWSDPKVLWDECVKYFELSQDNPLQEEKVFHTNGIITRSKVAHMRAMTLKSLCFYLRITFETWCQYRKDKAISDVIHEAEQTIYDQKFTGAAADMLNANIIARDLGLADKRDNTLAGPGGGAIEIQTMIPEPKELG